MPIKKRKVVTAQEMARVEGLAYSRGASEEEFMERAGKAVAEIIEEYLEKEHLEKKVTLLVGKGNNGGDAYVAGRYLLQKKILVKALHIYSLDSCGPLCQQQHERFKRAGGEVCFLHRESPSLPLGGLLVDGLVGTGFRGKAEGVLAQVISAANQADLPIVSIDIPSGVNGNTGEVGSVAICAHKTIYLELPKAGCFLGEGWNHVGSLIGASFDLGSSFIEQAYPLYHWIEDPSFYLPHITRNRHKYEAGYVLAFAGSLNMPGAAVLSCYAALKAGAGIVRLFYSEEFKEEKIQLPCELLAEEWDKTRIQEESRRAAACLIGPGIGRGKEGRRILKEALTLLSLPLVLDADALYILSLYPEWKIPEYSILTPHWQELKRLLHIEQGHTLKDVHLLARQYAEKKRVILVVKGAPTFLFFPDEEPCVISRGDPGMATAGAGDVLTGIIAALLAQKLLSGQAAILGVFLHGLAGELAAKEKTSYSLVASDIIHHLPAAYKELLRQRRGL